MRKGFTFDANEIRAELNAATEGTDAKPRFAGHVVFFDSFSDGRKITLHVEATVISRTTATKACVLLLVSTREKTDRVRETLRAIGDQAAASITEEK